MAEIAYWEGEFTIPVEIFKRMIEVPVKIEDADPSRTRAERRRSYAAKAAR